MKKGRIITLSPTVALARSGDAPGRVRVEPVIGKPPRGGGSGVKDYSARAYAAARPDRIAGRFAGFGLTSPRADLRRDLRGLINHATWAAQNVDYLRNYEALVRRHVVGRQGIVLQSQAVLDDGKTPDRDARDLIESGWDRWGRRGNCTVCGRLSWWQVQNIAATAVARTGAFLARIWRGADFGPFRFQIEVLSIDLLDLDRTERLDGGRFIESGIEFDGRGRILAFHLFSGHPNEYHTGRALTKIRVPAEDMILAWRAVEPMAALAPPESHTALRRFNMLSALEEAALTAARFGASNMAFFKRPEDDSPGGGGDVQSPIDEIEAGTVGVLPPGWDLAEFKGNYPDGEFPSFAKALMKGGAVGLGVSYSGLTGDVEGANFSSLRDGRGEERDSWRMFQRDIWETLHDEVFRRWLPIAILSGRLALPFTALDRLDLAAWRARGWPSVNPKDDAVMTDSDLGNMLRAPSEIVAERGGDWDETVAQFARDVEALRAAGLPLPQAFGPKSTPTGQPAAGDPPGAAAAPGDDDTPPGEDEAPPDDGEGGETGGDAE